MKLIVGLGNPGRDYIETRHNIGFRVVNFLAKTYKISIRRSLGAYSLSGTGEINGKRVVLAMPLTFMNFSGKAVRALLIKHRIDLKDLLVICDDVDLDLGRIKIKEAGSSGGHRGLKSIIDELKSRDFCRLRIGIGRPIEELDTAEYVLSPFTMEEKRQVKYIIKKAGDCCQMWVSEGIARCMNTYNQRSAGYEKV